VTMATKEKYKRIMDAIDHGNHKQAIKMCDVVIKKAGGKESDGARALKSVALVRMSRYKEAYSLCQLLLGRDPPRGDESVLRGLTIVLKTLNKGDDLTSHFERLMRSDPKSERLAEQYFFHLHRSRRFKEQQMHAMKMYGMWKADKYLWWAMVSMCLQLPTWPKPSRTPIAMHRGKEGEKNWKLPPPPTSPLAGLAGQMICRSLGNPTNMTGPKVEFFLSLLQEQQDFARYDAILCDEKFAAPIQNAEKVLHLRARNHLRAVQKDAASAEKNAEEAVELYRQLLHVWDHDNWLYIMEYLNVLCLRHAKEGKEGDSERVGWFLQADNLLQELREKPPRDGAVPEKTKAEGINTEKKGNKRCRGPFLGGLELRKRKVVEGIGNTHELLQELVGLMGEYMLLFGAIPSCTGDLVPYVEFAIEHGGAEALANIIDAVAKNLGFRMDPTTWTPIEEGVDPCVFVNFVTFLRITGHYIPDGSTPCHDDLFRAVERLCFIYQNTLKPQTVVAELFQRPTHYRIPATISDFDRYASTETMADLQLAERVIVKPDGALVPTDRQVGDALIVIAARIIMDMFLSSSTDDANRWDLLVHAAVILRYGLSWSPYNFELKLHLIRVYQVLGATTSMEELWSSMDVKQMQLDTLSYFVMPGALEHHDDSFSLAIIKSIRQFHDSAELEVSESLVGPFEYGSYLQSPEFLDFQTKLYCSYTRAVADTEYMFLAAHSSDDVFLPNCEGKASAILHREAQKVLAGFTISASVSSGTPNKLFVELEGDACTDHPFFTFKDVEDLHRNFDDAVVVTYNVLDRVRQLRKVSYPPWTSLFVDEDSPAAAGGVTTDWSSASRLHAVPIQHQRLLLRRASVRALLDATLPLAPNLPVAPKVPAAAAPAPARTGGKKGGKRKGHAKAAAAKVPGDGVGRGPGKPTLSEKGALHPSRLVVSLMDVLSGLVESNIMRYDDFLPLCDHGLITLVTQYLGDENGKGATLMKEMQRVREAGSAGKTDEMASRSRHWRIGLPLLLLSTHVAHAHAWDSGLSNINPAFGAIIPLSQYCEDQILAALGDLEKGVSQTDGVNVGNLRQKVNMAVEVTVQGLHWFALLRSTWFDVFSGMARNKKNAAEARAHYREIVTRLGDMVEKVGGGMKSFLATLDVLKKEIQSYLSRLAGKKGTNDVPLAFLSSPQLEQTRSLLCEEIANSFCQTLDSTIRRINAYLRSF